MAYCPFRRTYLPAAGHRSSKVIPWPAAKVDFKAHRQSLWSSRVYPQPAGRIWPAYTLLFKGSGELIVPADAIQGMVLGYLSHILADMLTPAGVPLLWPCRWRFRLPILVPQKGNQLERVLCMALFAYAVWMPQTLPENGAVRWSSQMINSLQFQFNRFINHQIEH